MIDYGAAIKGELMLAPGGEARAALGDDYRRMVKDGLLLDEAESFDALMARCSQIARDVNAAAK